MFYVISSLKAASLLKEDRGKGSLKIRLKTDLSLYLANVVLSCNSPWGGGWMKTNYIFISLYEV